MPYGSSTSSITLCEGDRLFALDIEGYLARQVAPWQMDRTWKPKVVEEYLERYYAQYPDVFSEKDFEQLPPRRPWDHAIELRPDFTPLNCKIYALTLDEQKALDEFLEENLHTGRIRPSKSPMASPFFFVSKKEAGAYRPCQDYRKLNHGTIKNAYPLPLVPELIDKLKDVKVFTKMDIQWGYNNIQIKELSRRGRKRWNGTNGKEHKHKHKYRPKCRRPQG